MDDRKVISVLLADFQFLTREGITSLINNLSEFHIIKQIENPKELVNNIKITNPDLIILDLYNNDSDIIKQLEEWHKGKELTVLVITNIQSKKTIQYLLKAGVKGILTKNCSEQEIVNALKAVSEGKRFFCNNILDLILEGQEPHKNDCDPTSLSTREMEVLKLIAKGNTTQKIANKLHISVHTVNSHRKNILKKLNIKSPIQLVSFAIESGLVNQTE